MSSFKSFAVIVIVLLFPAPILAATPDILNIVLTPGRTESELNFSWQTPVGAVAEATVQVALKSDTTREDFAEDKTKTFTGTSANFAGGLVSHKVTVGGLIPSTDYIYRLGTGRDGEWSDVYGFSTRDGKTFSVLLIGDAQIGSKNIDDDTAVWQDTLDKALQKTSDAAFIISVGDQVDSSMQGEYDAFLSLSQFKNMPFAPTLGNHDNSDLFSYYFNMPNEGIARGKTVGDSYYYFVYGNSLFVVINSNYLDYKRCDEFIRAAVKKNRNARWKILVMHHSVYGADFPRPADLAFRKNLVPIFDKYGIDVVLSGHDHIHVRTHFMLNNQIVQPLEKFPAGSKPPEEIPAGAVIKPKGTIYLSAAAGGTKYYDPASQYFDYNAARLAPYVPMFSRINITDSSFEILSYRADDMTVADSFIMVKAAAQDNMWTIFMIGLACVLFAALIIWKRRRLTRI